MAIMAACFRSGNNSPFVIHGTHKKERLGCISDRVLWSIFLEYSPCPPNFQEYPFYFQVWENGPIIRINVVSFLPNGYDNGLNWREYYK
jgi:hypothetical protein